MKHSTAWGTGGLQGVGARLRWGSGFQSLHTAPAGMEASGHHVQAVPPVHASLASRGGAGGSSWGVQALGRVHPGAKRAGSGSVRRSPRGQACTDAGSPEPDGDGVGTPF